MDWRNAASPQARDDLDSLLEDSMQLAGRALRSGSRFAPFMLVIGGTSDRNARQLNALPAGGGESEARTLLESADDRNLLRARATVFDVTAREPISGDAIKVSLEHRDGIAIDVLVPYSLTGGGVTIDMDRANAAVAPTRLWPSP